MRRRSVRGSFEPDSAPWRSVGDHGVARPASTMISVAVHRMAAGSPFFSALPLHYYGLEWIHSPAPLAHPMDHGSNSPGSQLRRRQAALGEDGGGLAWPMEPLAENWQDLTDDILRPLLAWPRHPFLLARFRNACASFRTRCAASFRMECGGARALFAGLSAHSVLNLDRMLSASFGLGDGRLRSRCRMADPRGGAQSITDALSRYLATLGGRIHTSTRIESFGQLPPCDVTRCAR